jgi:serine/threonine protein kinase
MQPQQPAAGAPRFRTGPPMKLAAWLSVAQSASPLARRASAYVRLDGEVLSVHTDQYALPSEEVDLRRTQVDYSLGKSGRKDFRVVMPSAAGTTRTLSIRCDSFEEMKTWATSVEHASRRSFGAAYTLGPHIADGSHSKVYFAYPVAASPGDGDAGAGGASAVYAVKVIKRRSYDAGEAAAVERERQIHAALRSHANVVQTVDVFATVDRVHIVMELMRGGTVADLLQRHPRLPEPHARVVMRSLFAALAALHAQNIVHRDVRPDNMFTTDHRFPMELALGDFGDASLVSDQRVNRDVLSSMTGDPAYMATEVVRRQKYGPAVDMWSAGVFMYRVLSGELPFTGTSTRAVYDAVRDGAVSLDAPVWAAVSPDAKSLIRQLLQPDPHKRISALAASLHHWLLAPPPSAPRPAGRAPVSAPPPSSAPFFLSSSGETAAQTGASRETAPSRTAS